MARSAFYRCFDAPLERFMAALAERALAYARAQPVALSGILAGVQDWSIVHSTTVMVRDALQEEGGPQIKTPAYGCISALLLTGNWL